MIELRKNSHEVVRVESTIWNGVECINARVWFKADDGEYRPSKKGLTLRLETAVELADAIKEVVVNGA